MFLILKGADFVSKRHPAKSSASDQTMTTVFTDVGCIIHTGVTRVQLRHMQHQLTDDELDFSLKFVQHKPDEDEDEEKKKKAKKGKKKEEEEKAKLIYLSSGGGIPIRITVKSIRQTATGFYLTGEIVSSRMGNPDKFGTNLNKYRDLIPSSWFQKGNQIQLLHRGAATPGCVISVTDPSTHSKIRLRTKDL